MFRFDSDKKAILEYLKIEKEDFLGLFFSDNELYTPTYAIFRDRRTNAIILSVRGTMSLMDAITDLACEYVAYKNGLVHSGMLIAAQWLLKNVFPKVDQYKNDFACDRIIVTGHSLGAAIASLIGILLNDEGRDDIYCYCFGCPAVVSIELVPISQKNIFVINYDQDIVGKLSYGSVMDFRIMVLVASRFIQGFSYMGRFDEAVYALTSCREELNKMKQHPKLMPPGQYFQIYKLSKAGVPALALLHNDIHKFKLTVMEKSEAPLHCEFMVTRDLLLDHIPIRYDRGLERCIQTIQKNTHPIHTMIQATNSTLANTFIEEPPKIEAILTPEATFDEILENSEEKLEKSEESVET